MSLILRPDQEDVRTKLRVALRSSAAVLVFAPTGFGKTVLAAKLIELIFAAKKRVIFCVHRIDLIRQTARTFEKLGLRFSYIAAGHHYNPHHKIFIASIATLQNRMQDVPADYIIVDEAHLSAAAGWAAVAAWYKAQGAKEIGLTGSPERLDGKPLGAVWDVMIEGPSVRWLIEQGHLSRYRAFSPAGLDLSGVHSRGGDYVASELDDLMSGKAVLAGAVRHWKRIAAGKRTIAFCPSVSSSQRLAAEFVANGIRAVALDGTTPTGERLAAFHAFAKRDLDLIVNCNLFCEGFDLAAQVGYDVTVECVLDNSPTQSLPRHLQKHGRGLRADGSGVPHILIDMVGGFGRLGFPDDEREWSLEGRKKSDRDVSLLTCPHCFAAHEPMPKCPECGEVYPVKESDGAGGGRVLDEVEGELEEIDVEAIRRAKNREQAGAKTLDDLVALGIERGHKRPHQWAAHIWTARQSKSERMQFA